MALRVVVESFLASRMVVCSSLKRTAVFTFAGCCGSETEVRSFSQAGVSSAAHAGASSDTTSTAAHGRLFGIFHRLEGDRVVVLFLDEVEDVLHLGVALHR